MTADRATDTAAALQSTLGRLYRRIRQTKLLGDLSLPESSALSQLRHGPASAAQLAKLEQISPQAMGTTLAGLERKGLIARAGDPADGRRILLSLTAAGEDAVTRKRTRRAQQLSAALEQLTPDERAQLQAALPLLDRIAEHM